MWVGNDGSLRRTAGTLPTLGPKMCDHDRRGVRGGTIRDNADGVEGVYDRQAPGREPFLIMDAQAARVDSARRGPHPECDGVGGARRPEGAGPIHGIRIPLATRSFGPASRARMRICEA